MGSLSRKIKRNAEKKKAKESKKDMAEKLGMFDRLPEECGRCEKTFDKTNKEMVKSWNVVVRNEKESVNLYCPDCWSWAKEKLQGLLQKEIDKNERSTDV